ncbi:DUF952 domain-containing protein [Evansella sp. AB-rgal1]|uniref:DUF952 domain-containing protein n=1 Tax=Evansella sp. AB-rgal1 TaxID=3242696 RepID=UPI00359CE428
MILHIVDKEEWLIAKAKGIYVPSSLESDGFIHCSTKEQVVNVANFLFKGKDGLVLLCIDTNKVSSNIIFEDLYDTGKLFPHIYGSLNTDAVSNVVNFPPNSDGTFDLPKECK